MVNTTMTIINNIKNVSVTTTGFKWTKKKPVLNWTITSKSYVIIETFLLEKFNSHR